MYVCTCICTDQNFVERAGGFVYGVATVSRIDKIIGLFCRIASLLGLFCKEDL